ncbi:MAG: hypothetical protein LBK47_05160 [Prevotellaceae bacterium]|jgi:hypothetical protein|nr:hypothetical protein [Prevotellaceae bacterium]
MLGNCQTPIYLGIRNGKVTQRVSKDTEGAIQRTTKVGTTVYEVNYSFVKGLLADIEVFEHEEYGRQWSFTLQDGTESYRLQLNENAPALTSLLFALPNCDVKKPIIIQPYDFVDKENGKHAGVTLKQDDKKVAWFFTHEDPKGLPELQEVIIDDKPTWNSTERMKFLQKYVNEHIMPQLEGEEDKNDFTPNDLPY